MRTQNDDNLADKVQIIENNDNCNNDLMLTAGMSTIWILIAQMASKWMPISHNRMPTIRMLKVLMLTNKMRTENMTTKMSTIHKKARAFSCSNALMGMC